MEKNWADWCWDFPLRPTVEQLLRIGFAVDVRFNPQDKRVCLNVWDEEGFPVAEIRGDSISAVIFSSSRDARRLRELVAEREARNSCP